MSDNVIRGLVELTDLRHRELMQALDAGFSRVNQSIETGFNRVDAALDRNASQIADLAVQIGSQAQSLDRLERSIERLMAVDRRPTAIDRRPSSSGRTAIGEHLGIGKVAHSRAGEACCMTVFWMRRIQIPGSVVPQRFKGDRRELELTN